MYFGQKCGTSGSRATQNASVALPGHDFRDSRLGDLNQILFFSDSASIFNFAFPGSVALPGNDFYD